ncbi:EAL domain-containing protein [Cognatishimia maritima]|uniref:EAL domain, c-di-GMP-specific phosphodiesterase class I (Or its enzymatically inactive variant) n=1 Tax=Cognatishimia maritima TaxID=870908 RepID=A0A1M5JMM5_9RHOB|nr:EAL domain-containing protein [Cognatishimia maritima]SHG41768.1 EAL domain, c-di-GMP-specific phosphodiesterase class I (or its enzymatically inactive variant) [Cognatishimia maritima]
MSQTVVEVNLKKGDILYRQGDPNDSAYIVESGEILLFSHVDGQRVNCERRSAGCILGETSILTGNPRAVSVEAVVDTRLYKVTADDILKQYGALDPVLRACIETTIDFVARINTPVDISSDDVPLVPSTLSNAEELIERFKFEVDIEKGLQNDQFYMIYQPIVQLADGRIRGFEALMRWQHPEWGNVPPDRFIDVAEAMGSVGLLTEFALVEACQSLARINRSRDRPLFASVNISGQDVGRAGFVDFLEHLLDLHDLDPKMIKLEVTETALLPEDDQVAANLVLLRQLGCGISIDDFGTGYSNLGYLKALPLTALKIDRAFAGDVSKNPVSRSIVRLLVGLGRELGVDVIAEGLEAQEDVEILCESGCRYAQGFHFYKPMLLPQLEACLSAERANHQDVA